MIYYPVNEIFQSIQGEGVFTGSPAIFIRIQGCGVGCPWCDTKHTWLLDIERNVSYQNFLQRDIESASWTLMTPKDMLRYISDKKYLSHHVVITGGEPCLYNLIELTNFLILNKFQVQLETSGTHKIDVHESVWVTVSPKIGMQGGLSVLPESLSRANEIKHPVARIKHIDELDRLLIESDLRSDVQICLQPINQNKHATELAIKTCVDRGWRLSVQLHKYLGLK